MRSAHTCIGPDVPLTIKQISKKIGTLSNTLSHKAFGQSEIFVLIIVHLFLAGRQGEKDGDDEDHCTTDKL